MLECGTCGFENDPDADRCELCGSWLPRPTGQAFDEQPHRVPTGVGIKRPDLHSGRRATDPGLGAVALEEERRSGPKRSDTDLGERATAAAVGPRSGSSGFRRAGSRPGAISNIGELAADSAAATIGGPRPSAGSGVHAVAPDRLLGNVKLVVEQGKIIGEQYLLTEPEMVIGRADPDSQTYPDIDLSGQDNDYVHRVHARLQFHDMATHLSVEHVGGANPTLVNNQPVEKGELVELHVGDRLRVGRVVMRLTNA